MSIKRRQLLQAAGLGAVAASVAMPAIAQTKPDILWRLTSSFPRALDLIYGGAEVFAQAVLEATDGKFRIELFPANQIVPSLSALDAVQNGTVEACQTAMSYFWEKDPTFALATGIPFGMNARQHNAWLYHGGGHDLFNDFLKDYNCVAVAAGNTGCQMGGWFRKEVKSAADLRGLNIRIGGLAGKVLQRLGAVPQPVAGSQIEAGLEKGTIDAADWVGPYDDEKLGLSKVAPFYYYPGWWNGGMTLHIAVNLKKWNELPRDYQAIVTNAAARANVDMLSRYDAANPTAVKRLVVAGTRLRPFPQDLIEAGYQASSELYKQIADANPKFSRLLNAYVAFRNDQYLWWQVAEYTYDNFMIRQRAKG